VDIALTTAEAQTRLRECRYRVIISDMGRGDNPIAGLEILEWLKKRRIKTPTIIFTSSQGVLQYGERAKQLGAVRCTAGAVSLLDTINSSLTVER
jgi:CheY-like chemotaxis protein